MGVSYATPVDIWSCGCIFAELFMRKPLFPGQYEMDQLNKIFDVIGVPDEAEWPKNAAVMRSNFQRSRQVRQSFDDVIPELDEDGKDLLKVSIYVLVFKGDSLRFKKYVANVLIRSRCWLLLGT